MVAEFKHVTVWETALTNSDFAKAHADEDYTPNGTMIQGWWNYKLTKASQLLTQELQGNLYSGKQRTVHNNNPYHFYRNFEKLENNFCQLV